MITPEEQEEDKELRAQNREKAAARLITLFALYLTPVLLILSMLGQWASPYPAQRWLTFGDLRLISAEILRNHFSAVIGLPMAGIFALWVVTILRSHSGPIEFQAMGFKFRGASGPVILWIACFLAITFAIRLLW